MTAAAVPLGDIAATPNTAVSWAAGTGACSEVVVDAAALVNVSALSKAARRSCYLTANAAPAKPVEPTGYALFS